MAQPTPHILTVTVEQADVSDERLDVATQQLIQMLREEARVDARPAEATNVPENARSAEAVTLGAVVLALIPVAIPAVVEAFKVWLENAKNRRIIVKAGDKILEFDPKMTSPEMINALSKYLDGDTKI